MKKNEINIETLIIDESKIYRNPEYEVEYEYRILGIPKYLLKPNNKWLSYPFRDKTTENKDREYEYDYEKYDRRKKLRVIVFNSLSDMFNHFEKNKNYKKPEQELGEFPHESEYPDEFDDYLNISISDVNYFELPIVERTEISSGKKVYLSIVDCRKIFSNPSLLSTIIDKEEELKKEKDELDKMINNFIQ